MNKNAWQAIKFTLFSISAGIIQAGSFALFRATFGEEMYWLNHLLSLTLSVLWNFTFNRRYTFRPTNHVGRDMALVFAYYAVFTPVTMWGGQQLVALGVFDWLVEGGVMVLNLVTEFLFQKFVVYRDGVQAEAPEERNDR